MDGKANDTTACDPDDDDDDAITIKRSHSGDRTAGATLEWNEHVHGSPPLAPLYANNNTYNNASLSNETTNSSSTYQQYQLRQRYDPNAAANAAVYARMPPLDATDPSHGSVSPNFMYQPHAMMLPLPPPPSSSLQQQQQHQHQHQQHYPYQHPQSYPPPPPPSSHGAVQPSRSRMGSSPKAHRNGATNQPKQQLQQQQNQQQTLIGAPSTHFSFETEIDAANDVYSEYDSLLRVTEQTATSAGYGSVKPPAALENSSRHVPWSFSSQQQQHHPTASSKPGNSNVSSGRRLPPSRANSSGSTKQQSSTEAATVAAIGASGLAPAGSPLRSGGGTAHRRAISDGDRRMAAGAAKSSRGPVQLPMDPSRMIRRSSNNSNRRRTNSESQYSPKVGRPPTTASPSGSVGGGGGGGHHRRGSSIASVGALSYMSDASMVSVVSNIRKSVFFDGVQQHTGHAKLSFPLSRVHLITIESATCKENGHPAVVDSTSNALGARPSNNSVVEVLTTIDGFPLKLGRLYKVPISNQEFEDYHRVFEDSLSGYMGDSCDDDDMLDMEDNRRGCGCRCDCPHCVAACVYRTGSGSVLTTNYFCLTIEDTIYRRLLDDVYASQAMPCGLYFCGHHEDVSRPSISIAVGFLVLVFVGMGYVALSF